ncbi:MAG: tRNA (adenine-N1)-methyltransferase [Deltaproteobacteria bacterium]|jgi:tRNA (adenine57-N1/adenine58-N1)-methyltransferase|nr:tRNA (adenine-N1)-methyltransferase [Deltaproteobacteria bacterium]
MPAYGDLIILVSPKGKRSLRRLEEGADIHGNDGVLPAALIAAAEYGRTVFTLQGCPHQLLRPSLYDLLRGVKRQTQVLYPKDIGYICLRLGVGNGSTIIEAGSGSGTLTMALSWFSGEAGQVHTYEARPEFYKLTARNLAWAGLGRNVTQHARDIGDGFGRTGADALFLDVRTPEAYLDQALEAVKPGARFAFFVPTTTQVSELLRAMETRPFADVEVEEIFVRRWKALADRLRPDDRMIAHTGFLLFARQQERCGEFEARGPRGTRERKQEAARLARQNPAGMEDGDMDDGDGQEFV